MSTSTNNSTIEHLNEIDRQLKQADMIRQYLQVTYSDTQNLTNKNLTTENEPILLRNSPILPLSSFNFDELRKDLKMAEERVERLRQELKEIQKNRDESFLKTSSTHLLPPINNNSDFLNNNILSITTNRETTDQSISPLPHEFLTSQSQQNQKLMINNGISSPSLLPNINPILNLSPLPADFSKEQRQRKFLLTLRQHREQLVIYLDSLKQVLNSLDQLASLEPTQSEIHLNNMKLDTIQQKSRQLRALKSNRSSQRTPFIECRIRQLEHDLVYMLSEHQKDVQSKLELNEQRSLMLLKIMQITDELVSLDQQLQQYNSNKSI